jgi:hypothetical protein
VLPAPISTLLFDDVVPLPPLLPLELDDDPQAAAPIATAPTASDAASSFKVLRIPRLRIEVSPDTLNCETAAQDAGYDVEAMW